MAHNGHGESHAPYEDDIDEDLWRSPSKIDDKSKTRNSEQSDPRCGGSQVQAGKSKNGDAEGKEVALRNELESVRKANEAIEGVIESLAKAQNNMRVSLQVPLPDAS